MSAPRVRPALGRSGSGSSSTTSSEYAAYSLGRGPLLGPTGQPTLARMRSVDHLNAGVPMARRRAPTVVNANGAVTNGDDASSAAAVDPFHEEFDELAISHAAKSAADFAATLWAFRESDWTLNRTSELPSAMLSEQRVLGAPGGLAAPDRYHRAPRWQLSPASILHHLPPDTKRQEVSALRELCRTRKRERDELEARRFEERLLDKARRKQQKEETKRRMELEAEEEYRKKEREKRKQRKKGGSSTRDNSASASYRSGGPGQPDLAAMLAAATAQAAINGQNTVAQMMLQDEYRGAEEDHSTLVMRDQLTAASMQADIVAALPADAPLCTACVPRAPCHLFTLQSYSCTAPLHPAGLTALELSLSGRNASASTLCVSLTSNAPRHIFFRPAPVFFVYANSTSEIGVDYVGEFIAECLAIPTAEAASTAVPALSPHAMTVSIRVLSRDDIANGFSTVHPSLYWEYAENQEKQSLAAEKIVQAASAAAASSASVVATAEARTASYKSHSYTIPVRWMRGDGSQNNLAGSMPAQYALLASVAHKEAPAAPTSPVGAAAAASASNAAPSSPLTPPGPATSNGGVRFLTPSMDPLRTPLFPGISPPSSAVPENAPSFGSDGSYLILDHLKSSPESAAPLSPSQQPPAEFEQVVASLRAQMAEHQRQIAALQANSPMAAVSPAASETITLQLPSTVAPENGATAPIKRARSAKAKTMLSMSDMRQTIAASIDPASLSVPFAVAGSGLLVPVPVPNLESKAAGSDGRRQSRRRSRNVTPDSAGVKSNAPAHASDATVDDAAAPVATAPVDASSSSSAADDEIKAERLARRRTVNQVDARRRDRDDADAEPRPMQSSADALIRRAEEDMRKITATHETRSDADSVPEPEAPTPAPAVSSLSPPRSSASDQQVAAQRLLHHAAQTALTWLDETSLAPVAAEGSDDGRSNGSASAPAAYTAKGHSLPSLTIVPATGNAVQLSDPVRESWQQHLRHSSPSGRDLRGLLVEWEAQLQLAEHRRSEQIQRLSAMRCHAPNGCVIDSTQLRSRLLYLRSELCALDDERATLMACELDIRGEARSRGLALDVDSSERVPLTAPVRSRPPSSADESRSLLALHRGHSAEAASDSESVQFTYADLRDRQMRLEVLRAQHRLLISSEATELRDTERIQSAREDRVFVRELISAPLEPPRGTPPSAAFFRTPTDTNTASSASPDGVIARIPAYLSATGAMIRASPRSAPVHASLDQLYGTTTNQHASTASKLQTHTGTRAAVRVPAIGEQRSPNKPTAAATRMKSPGPAAHRTASPQPLRPSSSQPTLLQQRQQRIASPALASNPYQLAMHSTHGGAETAARASKPSPYHH